MDIIFAVTLSLFSVGMNSPEGKQIEEGLQLLSKMEEQKTKIELLENENQQWQKLVQKLNSENSLLLKQNTELLNWNSR